ncbi:MAG TPA: hypothetical protein VFL80_00440 [Thermoanaerobaculia bacterium]|nr:hypothetical protein [Thermoanaerobaculia bacterium]
MSKPTWNIAPYFIVDDVVATANFYRDKLGFHYDRFFGEPLWSALLSEADVRSAACSSWVWSTMAAFPRRRPTRGAICRSTSDTCSRIS